MRRFFDSVLRIGFIGMIATGNHGHLESLRYTQNDKPLVRQKHLKKHCRGALIRPLRYIFPFPIWFRRIRNILPRGRLIIAPTFSTALRSTRWRGSAQGSL